MTSPYGLRSSDIGKPYIARDSISNDDGSESRTSDSEATELYTHRDFQSDPRFQIRRLTPARLLHDHGIQCIVWGRDALDFAFGIRSYISDCHLLIPDDPPPDAADLLIAELGYQHTAPDLDWIEDPCCCGPGRPHAYPTSIRLEYDHGIDQDRRQHAVPGFVLLTKMSDFHLNDRSRTLSLPRPQLNRMLRYPTLPTYLDSLVATILEPRYGRHESLESHLQVNISALIASQLRQKDRTGIGMISQREEQVLAWAREGDQPFVRRQIVGCVDGSWGQHQEERGMILTKMYSVAGCGCTRCTEPKRTA